MDQSLWTISETDPSFTSIVQTGTRTTDLEHRRGTEASQEADTTHILWGFLCTAQMLLHAAHHGKQSVNKNPGPSETFRERLPNYWNAAEEKKPKCTGDTISNGNTD